MEGETVDKDKNNDQKPTERETVPIVRGNTPRPFMYNAITTIPPSQLPDEQSSSGTNPAFSTLFPTKPPSAPPLPEEPDDYNETEERLYTTPKSLPSLTQETQTFAWLFEYGLEMDSTLLNTPERLDGLALLYGPVVLKGYKLVLECYDEYNITRTAARIVPDTQPDAQVWGVLYRVPQHITEKRGNEPTPLEMVHVSPKSNSQVMHVVVHEIYRNRVLPCITYGWRDTTNLHPLSSTEIQDGLDLYVRRLTSIAKKQKLPDTYVKTLAHLPLVTSMPVTASVHAEQRETAPSLPIVSMIKTEQHTEPLAALDKAVHSHTPLPSQVQRVPVKHYPQRWYIAFALYLFFLLLAILSLAIVQGIGIANDTLNEKLLLLGVPWLVLVYGLLGGCISSIITLGRTLHPVEAPVFVVITWFTRPFIGAMLAVLTYLLLSSGLFIPASNIAGRHEPLFLLIGALAGVCEGWLFLRKH